MIRDKIPKTTLTPTDTRETSLLMYQPGGCGRSAEEWLHHPGQSNFDICVFCEKLYWKEIVNSNNIRMLYLTKLYIAQPSKRQYVCIQPNLFSPKSINKCTSNKQVVLPIHCIILLIENDTVMSKVCSCFKYNTWPQ